MVLFEVFFVRYAGLERMPVKSCNTIGSSNNQFAVFFGDDIGNLILWKTVMRSIIGNCKRNVNRLTGFNKLSQQLGVHPTCCQQSDTY